MAITREHKITVQTEHAVLVERDGSLEVIKAHYQTPGAPKEQYIMFDSIADFRQFLESCGQALDELVAARVESHLQKRRK